MAVSEGDLRATAMALPQVEELDHFGVPSWRLKGKIFAQLARRPGVAILKLPKPRQELLMEVRPQAFVRAMWGRTVYCEVVLEQIEPDELVELVRASWVEVAPKRLAAALPLAQLSPQAGER